MRQVKEAAGHWTKNEKISKWSSAETAGHEGDKEDESWSSSFGQREGGREGCRWPFFPYSLWLIWITRKEHCQLGQNDIFQLHTIWATAQKNKNCLLILISPPRPLFWRVFVCKLPAICCLVVLLGCSVPTWRAFSPISRPASLYSARCQGRHPVNWGKYFQMQFAAQYLYQWVPASPVSRSATP